VLHLKRKSGESQQDPSVTLARDVGLDRIVDEAFAHATKLDQRLGDPGFRGLVSNRESCLRTAFATNLES